MDLVNIVDIEIYVKNEKIFKAILRAEMKYWFVMYSSLSRKQIRGKALKAMGVKNIMGESAKVSKLLPFIYKRKINYPNKIWIIRLIENTFPYVIWLAERFDCVKENRSSLSDFEPWPETSVNLSDDVPEMENDDEIIEESTPSDNLPTQRNFTKQNFNKLLNVSNRNMTVVENNMLKKISESQMMILWPAKSHHPNEVSESQKHDQVSCITASSTEELSQSIKIASSGKDCKMKRKLKYTQLKENETIQYEELNDEDTASTNKENIMIQKKIVCETEKQIRNFPLVTFQENSDSSGDEETSFLTELFTPLTRQPLFPGNVEPIVINSGSTSKENSQITP